ncbi:hypothetical protein ESCO_005157 [Escovopsis weberi]|uniref:Uncharacterized protein n=1 Tax=Escovopsis weberi TaxID=150374 RepID=A0A0M9VVV2_ESCWE|nr:hypothetical protein ESCO_005157 [Escovopsis weberi]
MPTYLCHGFRWERALIRIFVIVEDIDEAAPDWVISRGSSRALLERIAAKFDFVPRRAVLVNSWSAVKLLEEHDPRDTAAATRPYAYVADHAVRVDLGADVEGEMRRYGEMVGGDSGGGGGGGGGGAVWFERLRDELQAGAGIGWYVVVCGDEERYAPPREGADEEGSGGGGGPGAAAGVGDEGEEGGAEGGEGEDRENGGKAEGAGTGHSLRHRISSVGLRRLFIGKRKDSSP